MTNILTKKYHIYGIVQGVGFRPTVSRHANACAVKGSVSNKGPYVEIYASGTEDEIARFMRLIKEQPPKRAVIFNILEFPAEDGAEFSSFEIIESEKTTGEIFISPDIAVCDECKKELYDPENRRYLHPFINCTCCGPRLTILGSLPYDRERTSMKEFEMCPECEEEYYSPLSRRYDAQPVCCPDCGPEVYIIGSGLKSRQAITCARQAIKDGKIIAVKGIGGFHLCCDAENEKAVNLLRERKRRPKKPFAVMAKNLECAARECEISPDQAQILEGHQKPVLFLKRKEGGKISKACAPENPTLGIMLPYAPLQLLLFDYNDGLDMPSFLVMTSANDSGAPICINDEEAESELSDLCGLILSHNRKILIRSDDSVMDFYKGRPYMVRRSRGYAPLPVFVSGNFDGSVLGIGGELKNEFCIAKNNLFYVSPYIGDLTDVRTEAVLKESVSHFCGLLESTPSVVCCDLHPEYNSASAAMEMNIPVLKIQHHYAHVLSCMAENNYTDSVIGVSFDGTGYGEDGTIWGGEILLSDLNGFKRAAHISPFFQIGGDISAKEGFRIAAAIILEKAACEAEALKTINGLNLCSPSEAKILAAMLKNNINTVRSTSCGRIFDAAAAILGIRRASTFEGEAAAALMYRAMEFKGKINIKHFMPYYEEDGMLILPTEELIFELIAQMRQNSEGGVKNEPDTSFLAYFFHASLADMIARACEMIREKSGLNSACLTGGVFQNTLLLGMCEDLLKKMRFNVLTHSLIPPNDGGIALGQALYAMNKIN